MMGGNAWNSNQYTQNNEIPFYLFMPFIVD